MSSSNPFRKKGPSQPDGAVRFPALESIDTGIPQASTPPPPVSFRSRTDSEQEDEKASSEPHPPPPPPAEKKPKVVKKVRVLSPPPLSPDSPEWPNNPYPGATGAPQYPFQQPYEPAQQIQQPQAPLRQPSAEDPFTNGITDEFGSERETPTSTQPVGPGGLPAPSSTSFSRALQDLVDTKKEEELKEEMREEGEVLKAANNAKGAMDVNAFKRLLMTGNKADGVAGTDGASEAVGVEPGHQSSNLQDEGEESDSSIAVQIGARKKAPPPPPSSRHGKSIKPDADTHAGADDASELHHTGETTGKASEFEADHAHASKKSAPAPPPRRGHARAESKAAASSPAPTPHQHEEETSARSSMEGVTSKLTNPRHSTHAPAPPPPRRPHASHKLSGVQPSPTSATFSQHPYDSEKSPVSTPSQEGSTPLEHAGKSALPPPPPPARNTSVRRPPSVSSMEGLGSRSASGEIPRSREHLPPPPPPARKRGSSKGSMDRPSSQGTTSDAIPRSTPQQAEAAPADPGQGGSILADLDALQREVDALRGKMG